MINDVYNEHFVNQKRHDKPACPCDHLHFKNEQQFELKRALLNQMCNTCHITKTCPCNKHPLHPTFISKMGVYRVYTFFLYLFQNIDCRYLLEPRRF